MNELLKIHYDSEQPLVNGRDLHQFLEIETKYEDWFPRMREYGFTENIDYHTLKIENMVNNRVYTKTDHALTIATAKEIAMLQRNEKGKAIRQYLIKVEESWNSPELLMARALKMADGKIKRLEVDNQELQTKVEEMQPKALFADSVAASDTSILIGEMAKILKQNGVENMGQNRLFEWLRVHGYLISRKGSDYNSPTQKSMELGIMEIKEGSRLNADGTVVITKTTKITGKGQIYFINKFVRKLACQAA
ncbi:MAG: phage antirepressor KilAC domain-containing protein [Firmicutes bacterium]|nr:phage antirepressor KilAC domain-containing protein [Bacillota bacterium]